MSEESLVSTCSYGEFKASMGVSVSISLGKPRWWSSPPQESIWALTTRREYLNVPSDDDFIAAYTAQLARYGVDRIQDEFDKLILKWNGRPLVLLCFENLSKQKAGARGGEWCHRSLFSWWWKEQTGLVIPELGQVGVGVPFVTDTPDTPGSEPPTREPDTLF